MQIESRVTLSHADVAEALENASVTRALNKWIVEKNPEMRGQTFVIALEESDAKPKTTRKSPAKKAPAKATEKPKAEEKPEEKKEPESKPALDGIETKENSEPGENDPLVLSDEQQKTLQELYDELIAETSIGDAKKVLISCGFKSIPHVSPASYQNVLDTLSMKLQEISEEAPEQKDDGVEDDEGLFGDDAVVDTTKTDLSEAGGDDDDESLFGLD